MNIIETQGLTKKFGSFTAINDINMSVKKGEIHAICGENGAGKSTLMNMLFGLLKPTSGKVLFKGEEVGFKSPKDAIDVGIGMVHQHFKLLPSLTVYENVLLGDEITNKVGKIDDKKEVELVQKTIDNYSFMLNAKEKVENLSVGEQQKVEITKMLYRNVELLILDEPTAVLTPQETDELLKRLKDLKKSGTTIIIISHKLDEVKEISDRVTVIRRGEYVGTVNTSDVTKEQISRLMVGRDVITVKSHAKEDEIYGDVSLEVAGVSLRDVLNNVSLTVRKGEIVGIAGIDGNGQTELLEILSGIEKPESGEVYYQGKLITDQLTPDRIRELGFALVPEDRYKHGLNKNMSIWSNLIAGRLREDGVVKNGFFNKRNIRRKAERLIDEFDIRTSGSITDPVGSLSGGNAQKIIMAREIDSNPELIIMSQPTRGVDIGAIEFIHSQILELKSKNKAVLIVSSELDELLNLSDRIYVMAEGRIVGERLRKDTNREDLGMLMLIADNEERAC